MDSDTHEVYGHVVAADDFGDAQVIPFHEILQDIRLQFSAVSVKIPTPEDVRKLQQQPCQSVRQPEKTLPSSKRLFPLARQEAKHKPRVCMEWVEEGKRIWEEVFKGR